MNWFCKSSIPMLSTKWLKHDTDKMILNSDKSVSKVLKVLFCTICMRRTQRILRTLKEFYRRWLNWNTKWPRAAVPLCIFKCRFFFVLTWTGILSVFSLYYTVWCIFTVIIRGQNTHMASIIIIINFADCSMLNRNNKFLPLDNLSLLRMQINNVHNFYMTIFISV